jgi:hypothetical protein
MQLRRKNGLIFNFRIVGGGAFCRSEKVGKIVEYIFEVFVERNNYFLFHLFALSFVRFD